MKRVLLNNVGSEIKRLKEIKKTGKSKEEKVNANIEMHNVSFNLTNEMFPRPKDI